MTEYFKLSVKIYPSVPFYALIPSISPLSLLTLSRKGSSKFHPQINKRYSAGFVAVYKSPAKQQMTVHIHHYLPSLTITIAEIVLLL